jgi:hypothetical protein
VQKAIKDDTLDVAWFRDNRNWLGRGQQYRLLAEPLDVANWWGRRGCCCCNSLRNASTMSTLDSSACQSGSRQLRQQSLSLDKPWSDNTTAACARRYHRDKHLHGQGHYVDGIEDELVDDNRRRPGRFLLLQQARPQLGARERGGWRVHVLADSANGGCARGPARGAGKARAGSVRFGDLRYSFDRMGFC